MRKININEIKEEAWQSPRGKYAVFFTGISEALGRDPGSLDLSKRHPFDLEWNRVPPGKPESSSLWTQDRRSSWFPDYSFFSLRPPRAPRLCFRLWRPKRRAKIFHTRLTSTYCTGRLN